MIGVAAVSSSGCDVTATRYCVPARLRGVAPTLQMYKTVYYADGWLEIRESDNPDGWIATSSPRAVDP